MKSVILFGIVIIIALFVYLRFSRTSKYTEETENTINCDRTRNDQYVWDDDTTGTIRTCSSGSTAVYDPTSISYCGINCKCPYNNTWSIDASYQITCTPCTTGKLSNGGTNASDSACYDCNGVIEDGICTCSEGQYNNGFECVNCPTDTINGGSAETTSLNGCFTCDTTTSGADSTQSVCMCPKGYSIYVYDNYSIGCQLICPENSSIIDGVCMCRPGYEMIDLVCRPCEKGTTYNPVDGGNCLQCPVGPFLCGPVSLECDYEKGWSGTVPDDCVNLFSSV